MATVGEISAPYENFLLPVLTSGDGVCDVCHTVVTGVHERCYQCNQAARQLSATADVVAPISLAVKGGQLARELWTYKYGTQERVCAQLRVGLAAVLWRWLDGHERCVARAARVEEFTAVTSVPGTARRSGPHPLEAILGGIVGITRERFEPLLALTPGAEQERSVSDNRFGATRRLDGEAVLLVDDTWTSGAHVQSAASALRAGGARAVGVVVIGRHFNRQQSEPYRDAAEAHFRAARDQGWSWDVCCLD